MRLVVDRVLQDSESYASPGLSYVKWPNPVRPGDRLSLLLTVLEVRRSTRRPELGILQWRWQLRNQQALEVLDLEATSMFNLETEPAA
jgi:acyl dehydratase